MKNKLIFLTFLLIFIFSLGITLPLASFTVQESDGGEFATASVIEALVHPPGYPIYMEIAKILVDIFPNNPYHTLASFSGVCVSFATGLLFLIGILITKNYFLSFSASITWLLYEPTLRNSADAEVFGLHQVFVCVLVLACIYLYRAKDKIVLKTLLVGFVSGLGASHHHAIVLWAPLVICSIVYQGNKKSIRLSFLLLLISLFSALAGLFPYLFLFAYKTPFAYAPIESFYELVLYMFRADYGTFSMRPGISDTDVSYLPKFLKFSINYIPFFIISFLLLILKFIKEKSIIVLGVICSVILHFWLAYNLKLPDNDVLFLEFTMRFFGAIALSLAISFLWVFYNLQIKNINKNLFALIILLPTVVYLPKSLEASNARLDRITNIELEQIIKEVPKNSVFFSSLDRIAMGLGFKQYVENKRPDIIHIVSSLYGNKKYNKSLNIKYPNLGIDFETTNFKNLIKFFDENNIKIFSYYETRELDTHKKIPIGLVWQWIKKEIPDNTNLYIYNILRFCANYPQELLSVSKHREHSNYIVDYLFFDIINVLKKNLKDQNLILEIKAIQKSIKKKNIIDVKQKCSRLSQKVF